MDFSSLIVNEKITNNDSFNQEILYKKEMMIKEAKSWKGCTTPGSYYFHDLWESDDSKYAVKLGKYGKEYYRKNDEQKHSSKVRNPNDMHPTVFINGKIIDFDPSFDHVFNFFQVVSEKSKDALRILGCLVFRNAFLLDHYKFIDTDGITSFRYKPPRDAIDFISNIISLYDGISIEAYLYYMEAIALNEDVKYQTLGYDLLKGVGRTNNMKTYANIIAVLLGKASFYNLCRSFGTRGLAPITYKAAREAFPELQL